MKILPSNQKIWVVVGSIARVSERRVFVLNDIIEV